MRQIVLISEANKSFILNCKEEDVPVQYPICRHKDSISEVDAALPYTFSASSLRFVKIPSAPAMLTINISHCSSIVHGNTKRPALCASPVYQGQVVI